MKHKRLVCLCNHVSASEIKKVLRVGATTVSDVQRFTAAGTGCGRCIREIIAIVEKYKSIAGEDPQLRMHFDTIF